MRIRLLGVLLLALPLVHCADQSAPKLYERPLPKLAETFKYENVSLTVKGRSAVDILFVIDNSGSMSGYQQALATNATEFTKELAASSFIDYHIGVVTSDMSKKTDSGTLRGWVARTTPDRDEQLKQLLVPGSNGDSIEIFFDPVIAALSSPKVDEENRGFYRKEAYIAIVFVTDSGNQSDVTSAEMFEFLMEIKNFDRDKILGYGAIIPPTNSTCSRSGEPVPFAIFDFLTNFVRQPSRGKNYFNLCGDFGQELARIGQDLEDRIEKFISLTGPLPVVSTIQVKYGEQDIPRASKYEDGWTYDPDRRGIVIGKGFKIEKQENAELYITYVPANLGQ